MKSIHDAWRELRAAERRFRRAARRGEEWGPLLKALRRKGKVYRDLVNTPWERMAEERPETATVPKS